MRRWLAHRMRKWADRIDRPGAPKSMGYTFTFERGEGVRFRQDGRGCRLWYLGDLDYDRAHDDADSPTSRIDWTTMALRARRG